jgi:hypothetical protein
MKFIVMARMMCATNVWRVKIKHSGEDLFYKFCHLPLSLACDWWEAGTCGDTARSTKRGSYLSKVLTLL